MRIKIFADGADLASIEKLSALPVIKGFTTNPTLMRKAGVTDYVKFAQDVLALVPTMPVSFEVIADEFIEMRRQAERLAALGSNVYVKIPITNTQDRSSLPLITSLNKDGIKVNVTAITTYDQVKKSAYALRWGTPAYISVFAGRIADTGIDPLTTMKWAVDLSSANNEIIWASPREVLNVFQAEAIGCHIITVTPDILKKLDLAGKNLSQYSLETVKMFYNDAVASGLTL